MLFHFFKVIQVVHIEGGYTIFTLLPPLITSLITSLFNYLTQLNIEL